MENNRTAETILADFVAKGWDFKRFERTFRPAVNDLLMAFARCNFGAVSERVQITSTGFNAAELDRTIDERWRRETGAFFTPKPLAELLAGAVSIEPEVVCDLSCGSGNLLIAAARRFPTAALIGIDTNPLFALATAVRVFHLRGFVRGDRFEVGDGLAFEPKQKLDVVIANPPYLREKGRKDFFATLKLNHPNLAEYFVPRMDLMYLFLHRGFEVLREGGQMVSLTSDYWTRAEFGHLVRRHLMSGHVEKLNYLSGSQFEDAKGHHSLISVVRKTDIERSDNDAPTLTTEIERGQDITRFQFRADGEPWAEWSSEGGVHLSDVAVDKQGIISGADKVTKRLATVLDVSIGTPIFVGSFSSDIESFPLLRSTHCFPNRIVEVSLHGPRILFPNSHVADTEKFETLLSPFRPILEKRREVRKGVRRWFDLQWPRQKSDFGRPKLVCPRRAASPSWTLDLAGHFVSSDCTYLLVEDDVIQTLVTLMVILNDTETQMRAVGKVKGAMIEFHSGPLRRLELPMVKNDSGWEACGVEHQVLVEGFLARLI